VSKLTEEIRECHEKIEQLEEKTTQACQVIGSLLDKLGKFESEEGQRALDYFCDPDVYDWSFLPWALKEELDEKP
jgi:hypothetical protein